MTYRTHYRLRLSLFAAILMTGIAGIAVAGAPGSFGDRPLDRSVMLISPDQPFDPAPQLSPAEIRNAVSVRMDSAEQQGFEVDRASVDGIGLMPAAAERLVEAPRR